MGPSAGLGDGARQGGAVLRAALSKPRALGGGTTLPPPARVYARHGQAPKRQMA
jgi:hypothetical protein